MQSEDPDLLQAMVVSFMIHHFLKPPGDVGLRKDLHPAAQAEPFHLWRQQMDSYCKTQSHELEPEP